MPLAKSVYWGIESSEITDHTVAENDLATSAIPHITATKSGVTSITNTAGTEVLNTTDASKIDATETLTTSATRDFIIMYSANVTTLGSAAWINISKVDIITSEGVYTARATPQEMRIADATDYGVVVSETFYADSVSAGTYGVNITATCDDVATNPELYNQTIVVMAL